MLALWVVLLALGVPRFAYAYIDPATTTYLIQIATAIIITVGVSFTIVLYRFRMLFTKLWVRLSSLATRRTRPAEETSSGSTKSKLSDIKERACDSGVEHYTEEGSAVPPSKAYGFAYQDAKKRAELKQAFEALEQQGLAPDESKSFNQVVPRARQEASTLKERWADASYDSRSFRHRLGLAALINASLIFTVIIFGPLEMFAGSRVELPFDLVDFLPSLALFAVGLFVVLTGALALLRGRLYNTVLCIITGLLLACYIQALFFNGIIGELTGDSIPWHEYGTATLVNLGIWIAIVVGVLVVHFLSPKAWQYVTVFVGSLIIATQMVGLLSVSEELTKVRPLGERSLVLTSEGMLELSSQKNIVVFLLDTLDGHLINDVRKIEPHFFDELEGFTEFDDNITRYIVTMPSVAYSFTGMKLEDDLPISDADFLNRAFDQRIFIDDLVTAGWNTKLYLSEGYDYASKVLLQGRASNLRDTSQHKGTSIQNLGSSFTLIKRLTVLSMYRHAPIGLKPAFWMSSAEVSQAMINRHSFTSDYQKDFMNDLLTEGLSADIAEPVFVYLHLDGPHRPHYLDASGFSVEGNTDLVVETQGCFSIIYEYIRQLKELGIYDDTCIIITGDHGNHRQSTIALFYKPVDSSLEPLAVSTAPVDDSHLVPTLLEQAGVSSSVMAAEGFSYSQVSPENTPLRERILMQRDPAGMMSSYTTYEIRGRAANLDNWQLLD